MLNRTNPLEKMSLSLPVTLKQRLTAKKFAQQQLCADKLLKVEMSIIAIFGVKNYLDIMGIPTSLENSDSWNPLIRLCTDIADLEIVGIGKLECIAIPAGVTRFSIPSEVWKERIGYVVVEVQPSYKEVILRGFLQKVSQESIKLERISPLESLLERIHQYQNLVNLKNWLERIFEKDWQPVDKVLSSSLGSSNFRLKDTERKQHPKYAEGGKIIDLGIQLKGLSIALILDFKPEEENNTSIRLQVHPGNSEQFLPPNLQLIVLDDSGKVFLEAKSREQDNYIQLVFSGESQEEFSVKIAFRDMTLTENFVI
jgi:hypothetical protein